MNFFSKIKIWYIILVIGMITVLLVNALDKTETFEEKLEKARGTVSLRMYESIEHWSDSLKVPKYIAYNVAYLETGYRGPFHFGYKPYLVSSANAVGPMQIITTYAHPYTDRKITSRELMYDIDLNVEISMKMLNVWYKMYGNWAVACGAYNTGRPIVNEYASYAANNKNYKNKWVNFK